MSLWKGRIEGSLDPDMEKINRSLPVDIRLVPYEVAVNKVWVVQLRRIGVIPPDEAGDLLTELDRILADFLAGRLPLEEQPDEDVHSLIERLLTERVGEAGAKVHAGRSRNDQVATSLRLFLIEACGKIRERIADLIRVLLDRAQEHRGTVMPGYTHLQPALPITLGFDLVSFAAELLRDRERFSNVKERAGECPLGSGSLAGSALEVSREEMAKDLGMTAPTINALDGVSSRDAALEFLFAATICVTNLSRRAEDGIIRASREFGWHRLPDSTSTGSSMMPQKRNPDGLEIIRSKAGTILGLATGFAATLKGLPHAYAKDLQEDKAAVFRAFDTLDLCLSVMKTHFLGLVFNTDRMRQAIPPECAATDFADALVRKGLPFRQAHERVAKAIREQEDPIQQDIHGRPASSPFSLKELAKSLGLSAEDGDWTPEASIARRRGLGGVAPEAVQRQIDTIRARLAG